MKKGGPVMEPPLSMVLFIPPLRAALSGFFYGLESFPASLQILPEKARRSVLSPGPVPRKEEGDSQPGRKGKYRLGLSFDL